MDTKTSLQPGSYLFTETKVRRLIVSTYWQALHTWVDAPLVIGFLKNPHYHQFKITVHVRVTDPQRQHEFHILRSLIDGALAEKAAFFERAPSGLAVVKESCESLAEWLLHKLRSTVDPISSTYPDVVQVDVFEDEMQGASYSYDAQPSQPALNVAVAR